MKHNIFSSFGILLLLIAACNKTPRTMKETEPPVVKGMVIELKEISIPVLATGMLASAHQSNLSFMTGGLIRDISAREGGLVKQGEVLASLDLTEINSRLRQAELALEKANRDYERAQNLYRDSVATLETMQNATTAKELAESNYRIAAFSREHSVIRAPSDGKILQRLAEKNEVTGQGRPVFVFASTEAIWVLKVRLSDREVVNFSVGDPARLRFDAFPGADFPGKICLIGNSADPITGTFEVEIGLELIPERLVSGLVGTAELFPAAAASIVIPSKALLGAGGMNGSVLKLSGGVPVKTPIKIKALTNEGIVVSSGLSAGDTLITEGANRVKPGQKVIIEL
jgi:RND family efflux transporter MFP subunit